MRIFALGWSWWNYTPGSDNQLNDKKATKFWSDPLIATSGWPNIKQALMNGIFKVFMKPTKLLL